MTVHWTESALADLVAIEQYTMRHSPKYARSLVEGFFARTEQLAEFPKLGRVVPEFANESLRELIASPYRIIYRVHENELDVLAVVHSARRMPSDL